MGNVYDLRPPPKRYKMVKILEDDLEALKALAASRGARLPDVLHELIQAVTKVKRD